MKTHRKVGRKIFLMSALSYLLSSISVFLLLMVEGEGDGSLTKMDIVIGTLFWFGIILGSFLFYVTWRLVKNDNQYIKVKKENKPAFISLFSTRLGIIIDIVFFISLLLVVVNNYIKILPDILMLISMFFMLYSFWMHFMSNGRVYKYLFVLRKKKEGEIV